MEKFVFLWIYMIDQTIVCLFYLSLCIVPEVAAFFGLFPYFWVIPYFAPAMLLSIFSYRKIMEGTR